MILRLFISVTLTGGAFALGATPTTNALSALTLNQALELAELRHPDLAESRALIAAAEGRARQAGTAPNPELIGRIEEAPLKGQTLDEAQYLGGIAQTVPLGSRLAKARKAEQFERERRARELEVRRRELHRRVQSAFATALYQESALRVQEKIAAGGEKLVAVTKARVDAGDALREDLARAELEQARTATELRRAVALRGKALNALLGAIGDPHLDVQSLSGSLDTAFEIPTLEALATDLASHPSFQLADAEVAAGQARLNLAQAERVPDIKVELLYRRLQGTDENAFDAGVSLPLPLFDRNQGRLREARAEIAAAEARARLDQNELNLRLRQAHVQLAMALANSRSLKADVLPRADTVLNSAEARYRAGESSLGEVLPVRRDWANVQLAYLESLRDVMQAWADLTPFLPK